MMMNRKPIQLELDLTLLDEPTDDEIDSWVLDDKYSTRDFIEHFEAVEKEKRTEPLCSYCKKPLGPNDRVHVCKNRGKP